ncbi:MAG: conjugative transposon protein TraJ [Bacteroidota bacterium]
MESLQLVLAQLYKDMLPMCSQLIGVGRLIGGFGALWFIAARVWKHIAAAEPVDFFPLLRPFAIGLCIMLFPSVIAIINGVLQPTVAGTEAMVKGSNDAIQKHLQLSDTGELGVGALNPANWIRELVREFLELIFEAAGLCINTIRTFYLLVLAIIGPIVFGLSIFDGFQHTITVWLARYINVFLWLPVSNIFGAIIAKIQENMLKANTGLFGGVFTPGISVDDTAYIIFMLIAIVGYFTVPSVANYIVNAGGGNALVHKISTLTSSATKTAGAAMSGGSSMAADAFGNGASRMSGSMADNSMSNGYFKDKK